MEKNYEVRKVENYNPYDDLITCRDVETGAILSTMDGDAKLCLPAAAQEKWFWLYCQENGIKGRIVSESIRSDLSAYEFETKIYMGDYEGPVSSGHALRLAIDGVTEKFPPYETAETMSRSRALSAAGFGPEIALYLKKRDEEAFEKAMKEKEEKAKMDGTAMEAAKAEAEKTLGVLSGKKPKVTKKEEDPFEEAGIKPPEAKTPEPEKETVEETEPVKADETPKPEPEKENPSKNPKLAKEEKPAKETKAEKRKPEKFVISLSDTGMVPSIRGYAGKNIDSLSKEVLKQILERFESKISPAFADAIEARI